MRVRSPASPALSATTSGCVLHVVAARDPRLRVRIAVREQLTFAGDDERVALRRRRGCDRPCATALRGSAGRPASRRASSFRRTATIAVGRRSSSTEKREIRTPSIVEALRAGHASRSACRAGSRRSAAPFSSRSVSSLNSGNCKTKFLRMRSCCHCCKAGLLQVGGDRLEDVDAAGDVQLDLLGHLAGDVQVAQDDRLLGAGAQRIRPTRRRSRAAARRPPPPSAARSGWKSWSLRRNEAVYRCFRSTARS